MDKIKVVLISDAKAGLGKKAETELVSLFSQTQLSAFSCAEMDAAYCLGCFACRYKTPGKCIYEDDMEKILPAMVGSDIIIVLTRLTYGCYSSDIKRVLDRIIPFETPFLRIFHEETHLIPRYPKNRKYLTVAYAENIEEAEAAVFSALTERNILNLDVERIAPVFLSEKDDLKGNLKMVCGELLK